MAFDILERNDTGYWPWYDYNSAFYDGVTSGYLQLFTKGCNSSGILNCTAACLDTQLGVDQVWNGKAYRYNTLTLANCMALPFIANLLAAGRLTEQAANLAQKYQIPSDASLASNASAGWPVINNCINSYCDSQDSAPGCSGNSDDVPTFTVHPNKNDSSPSMNVTFPAGKTFNAGLCHQLDAVINPDIGGIGDSPVSINHLIAAGRDFGTSSSKGMMKAMLITSDRFVSYLMQMFIVLSAWLAYHFWTWAVWPLTAVLVPFHGKRAWLQANQFKCYIRESPRTTTQYSAFVSALVDFQEAQVFFMLAVQIAALIALHNPSYVEATSWQQLWNNVGILYNLAFGGSLPVLFSLFILRLADKRSVYTLAVSFCCVASSATTWFLTWDADPDPTTSISYTGPDLPACGGMIAPIKYCYDYGWFFSNSDATPKGRPMLVFCFVVQLCLILDQVALFPLGAASGTGGNRLRWVQSADVVALFPAEAKTGSPENVSCFEWLQSKILKARFWTSYEHAVAGRFPWLSVLHLDTRERRERAMAYTHSTILLGTELTFVALNAILITDYAHLLLPNDFQSLSLKNWSLGQVISVTIWVPVLLEYLWHATVGTEEGFDHRLHESYQVVQRPKGKQDGALPFDGGGGSTSGVSSTAMDLAPLSPRARYERMNSDFGS